jgi:hypothetical protein
MCENARCVCDFTQPLSPYNEVEIGDRLQAGRAPSRSKRRDRLRYEGASRVLDPHTSAQFKLDKLGDQSIEAD